MLLFLIDRKVKDLDHHEIQKLLNNSPTYQLLKELLIKKRINSTFFCNKYYLSRATFQRRKKKLNILLEHFSISLAKKSLQGEEKNIRWFLIQFFQSIAPFDMLNDFFNTEEWALFKRCKQNLIKKLNHNLNKCFEIWLLAVFFYSREAQKNFKNLNHDLADFKMTAFYQAFPFLSTSDLEFLNSGYHLLHPEQNKKLSPKISPEAKLFVKNLNKFLPISLNKQLQKNLTIELTYFINLHQYLPTKLKSFIAERYLNPLRKNHPHKAQFHHFLQKKLVHNTTILKNSLEQNDCTCYFLSQLIDNVLHKSEMPIYFNFRSDFDPYMQRNLKMRIHSTYSQLLEAEINKSVDLTIHQSDHIHDNQTSTFYFPFFVTENIWLNFIRYIEKIYYQKLTDYLLSTKIKS
ncbi:MAG: helix-turn-helix domain-containing protein [Streptococcaceae bacterium]|jgi:hypothetical protein|nr:helix-turn-helix domain-containing protein [Streptococcaceae bacterium]